MATAAEVQTRDKIFIDGEWVEPQGTETIEVVNPTTEEPLATVPAGTPAHVDRAVTAARAAFGGWAADAVWAERAELARRARRRAGRAGAVELARL